MPFPSPPWHLTGQAWGSVFRAAPPDEPAGLFVVAFVDYEPGSTLAYSELLVARRVPGSAATLAVRDMFVDSATSRDAGRALWGLPKELAAFSHASGGVGPAQRHEWRASVGGRTLASAEFVDTSALSLRAPLRGGTRQQATGSGELVASLRGSSRGAPCLGHWTFAADGPLGWLAGRPPLASVRLRDFRGDFA